MIRRKNNKNLLIIILIVLLLVLGIGYAAFSDTLTISGTANAKGTFDLEFQNADVVEGKAVGVRLEGENATSAEISANKNTLVVKVADLAHPGAGVEFTTDIVNVGTIPAKIEKIEATNITGNADGVIKIKGLEVLNTEHPVIGAGEKCNIHFTVEWPKDSTVQLKEVENLTFSLGVQYTQSTDAIFNGKASHDGNIIETPAVVKEDPTYEVPTGLSVEYNGANHTLSELTLPDGFSFQDPLDTVIGVNVGTYTAKVMYTPENTEKYNIVKDIVVEIEIKKLNNIQPPV